MGRKSAEQEQQQDEQGMQQMDAGAPTPIELVKINW